jgi:uncharacterized protein (TIGR03437 family)
LCLAAALLIRAEAPNRAPKPLYVPSSIVNSANPEADGLAPNTIASIYGTDLAFTTRAVAETDVRAGIMPTTLPTTGVKVLIGGIPAHLYYVSPTQINFLVPSNLMPGNVNLQVGINSLYGPAVRVRIVEAAPALFQADPEFAVASGIAAPGEVVTLYATGLGAVVPQPAPGEIPEKAAWLEKRSQFRVVIGETTLPRDRVLYVGVAPFFAGLYQINLRMPDQAGRNPEIRIGVGDRMSPAGVRLRTDVGNP